MNDSKHTHQPPKWADKLLNWVCKPEWLEPIRGDLFEQYQLDLEDFGKLKANYRYWINALNFLRPFALRRNTSSLNQIAMIKNILKTFKRQLIRRPLQSSINIFGLTFGLLVAFLTMQWINYHESFDQFHQKKDRIYQVFTNSYSSGETQTFSGAILEITESAEQSISAIDRTTKVIANWRWPSEQCFKIDPGKQCVYSRGIFADSSFFNIFDFQVISGATNPLAGDTKTMALSESLARKLFGDTDPVGKEYLVDNHRPVIISAVFKDLPPNSSIKFDFIAPLGMAYILWGANPERIKKHSFITYMTLKDENKTFIENQINSLPIAEEYKNQSIFLHPLNKVHLHSNFENGVASGGLVSYVRIIGLFAIFILIMSIVNFINLTTAQSSLRSKEIGVRKVNGASMGSLHFQFLIETLLKVLIASILALLVAYLLLPALNELINEKIQFAIDGRFIISLLALVTLTTILSGIYPAIVLSRFNPVNVLKSLPFKGGGKQNIRRWLTVAQISISGVIVLLTTVFYLQLQYMQTLDTGYDRKGILIVSPTYRHILNYEAFADQLKQNHLIQSVGISNANMLNATNSTDNISWKGKDPNEKILFKLIGCDNGMLEVFTLPLIDGTNFNPNDTSRQIILTKSAVRQMNLSEPVGQSITMHGNKTRIVGVVNDFNTQSLHESLEPTIIYPIRPENAGTVYIRYNRHKTEESVAAVDEVYNEFESFFNMKYKVLDEEYSQLYKEEKVISNLSVIVMSIAIAIAVIGIIGLSTFNTMRRLREIGLRKIFGANGSQILQMLSKEFIWIALIANLIAWPLSYFVMNSWLSAFAYRINIPFEIFPLSLILTSITILILVAIQSLRVLYLNPTEVIKND